MENNNQKFDQFFQDAFESNSLKAPVHLEGKVMKSIKIQTAIKPLLTFKHYFIGCLFIVGLVVLYLILPASTEPQTMALKVSPLNELLNLNTPKLKIPKLNTEVINLMALLTAVFWIFYMMDRLFQRKIKKYF